ncbi:phage tail assembly chaperone family protein, TAC [Acinetobacter pollinis]|uniref:Phage tail assembly chaperone family protein, TAC n=1 Tax=Acinetobacter pollinis TaxID=2605270 RepID=A0ABU6DQ29_9GAMM|nr:phage tail assembly chaperone family protein, TAC [Acinetobacter pollinis]MEB5475536.1 phage tail assembly chaperone family protein, TAC [Acinetobacter pollinis]
MKKLSLGMIKSGLLVAKPTAVSIKVENKGEKFEFETFIKPFSYETAVARMTAFQESKAALAGIIAASLYDERTDEEGQISYQPSFTTEEVRETFNQSMTEAIWEKIAEVNGLGKKKEDSTQTQNSSVKSELPQDEVLQK